MHKKAKKSNVLYRLFFNRADERCYGRFAFFFDSLMQSFASIFANGAFYTAFLRLNDISMSDVGVMTYMPILANVSCIFAPFIFRNIKRRKPLLLAARIAYYLLNLVGVALVPFLIANRDARIFLMAFLLSLANVVWGLFIGGFTDWELSFLPQDGTREEFFAYRSLICALVSSVTQIGAAAVATAIEATAPDVQNLWLFWLRIGGFAFIFLDIIVFLRAKEYPYPESEVRLNFKSLLTVPMKSKPFRRMILIRALVQIGATMTSSSWTYYLMDCGFAYSTLSFLGSVTPVMSLLLTPFALRLFRKMGCVNNLIFYRALEVLVYIGYAFVVASTASWLYPIMFLFMQVVSIGVGIADINFAYLFMPEKDRLTYHSFYYMAASIASFFGSFLGAQFITRTEGKSLSVFGISLANAQALMIVQAALIAFAVLVFAILRKTLCEAEHTVKNAAENL